MKGILAAAAIALCAFAASAQDREMNSSAENIIGQYFVSHEGENSRVRVFKDTDGTFKAQVKNADGTIANPGTDEDYFDLVFKDCRALESVRLPERLRKGCERLFNKYARLPRLYS